ncbi:Desumoylating isopeptidase 1 [Halotydeus destructor]|nr:Desumoylating isopeptidase 1 [Halotydeus destructor]
MSLDDENYANVKAETSFDIQLYIYDMSKGLAKVFSAMFLGKELPGIWHTSIIAYEREYFFGGMGIESCNPGETALGHPDQIIQLGKTELPYSLFLEYIFSLGDSTFHGGKYDLFHHNCNTFSNELALLLTGRGIPQEIIDLPSDFLSTPFGQSIKQYLAGISIRPQGTGVNFTAPQLTGKRSSPRRQSRSGMDAVEDKPKDDGQAQANSDASGVEVEADDVVVVKPARRKSYKYSDPPILFTDVQGGQAVKKLSELVSDVIENEEKQFLKEWNEYLTTENGAWILEGSHLDLFAKFLTNEGGKYPPNVPLLTLEALQAAALKDDFVLILHQDRKDHRVMSYINRIEQVTLAEQEEIAKLICNLCSQPNSFDWLMYITEWEDDGQLCNNCRVTTRTAVHTVLNDQLTTLQRVGVSLIFNLSLKEVFDDTATELATAVLQFIHGDLPEDQSFLCLTSLVRFMDISINDVPALTKMLGPDITKFKGQSQRVDDVLNEIETKLSAALSKST